MTNPESAILPLQRPPPKPAKFYTLEKGKAPWGDYGDMLIHGLSDTTSFNDAEPSLSRTGPFVPPLTMPGFGCLVVTEKSKQLFEDSGLPGVSFVPARKAKIVPLRWEEWNLAAKEPAFYPEGGEPEGYILQGEHSPELAAAMPELWRLSVRIGAAEIRIPKPGRTYGGKLHIKTGSWNGSDFFCADLSLRLYVSSRAQQWLAERFQAWVSFEEV